jgi:hypothetical protein
MLNMRTGTSCPVKPPPVSQVLQNSCAFVEYRRGGDEKLWFVCIHDILVLRLYSCRMPPPPPEEGSATGLVDDEQWSLEREVQLRERNQDLADAAGDLADAAGDELRARNVHSRNGYFAVNLRSMRVQRLSGVDRRYLGRLYPFLCHHDS